VPLIQNSNGLGSGQLKPTINLAQLVPKQSTSRGVGEELATFSWCYAIDALPIPRQQRTRWSPGLGYRDDVICRFLNKIFVDLERRQGDSIHYCYALERGLSGWRHAHVFLGSVSRVEPAEVEIVFKNRGFSDVKIRIWKQSRESGYFFKTLDKPRGQVLSDSDEIVIDTNLVWNKECRNKMKINRKHLSLLARADDSPMNEWASEMAVMMLRH
jgi:hypothetical protein